MANEVLGLHADRPVCEELKSLADGSVKLDLESNESELVVPTGKNLSRSTNVLQSPQLTVNSQGVLSHTNEKDACFCASVPFDDELFPLGEVPQTFIPIPFKEDETCNTVADLPDRYDDPQKSTIPSIIAPCTDKSFCDILLNPSSTKATHTESIPHADRSSAPDVSSVSEGRIKLDPNIHVLFGKEHGSKGHGRDEYFATAHYRKRTKDLKKYIKNSSENVDKNALVKPLYQELKEMGFICIEKGTVLSEKKVLGKMKQALMNKTPQNSSSNRKSDPKRKVIHKAGKRPRHTY